MAKLTRVTGKVFGSAATATVRGIGQFGSAAAGSPNLTTDVATIQALPAYLNGWGSAVITSRNFPPIEEVTGVLKTISYQTCYNLQEGVAEYDINTEYTNTSIVKSTNNGIITFYASLQDNNIGNSLTDTDYWKPTVLNLDNKADVDLTNTEPTSGFATAMDNAGIRTVVETYSSGSSWYRVWSDGWKEQGGQFSTAWAEVTVVFLKSFVDGNYSFVSSGDCTNVTKNAGSFVGTFAFGNGQAYNVLCWYACGY